jgi:hypothetical protein
MVTLKHQEAEVSTAVQPPTGWYVCEKRWPGELCCMMQHETCDAKDVSRLTVTLPHLPVVLVGTVWGLPILLPQ